eukprot:g1264.t1
MCGNLHTMMEVLEIECKADRTRKITVLHPKLTPSTSRARAISPTPSDNTDNGLDSVLRRLAEMQTILTNLTIARGSPLDIRALERAGIDDCATVLVLSSTELTHHASRRLRVSYGLAEAEMEDNSNGDELQAEAAMDMDNVKIVRLIRSQQRWESKTIITELANPTTLAYVEPTAWWPQDQIVGAQDFNLAPAYAAGDVYNTHGTARVLCTLLFQPWLLDVINNLAVGACYVRDARVEAQWFGDGGSVDEEGRATGPFSQVFEAVLKEKQAIAVAVLKRPLHGNGSCNDSTSLKRQSFSEAAVASNGKLPLLITNPSNRLEVNTDDCVLVIPCNTARLQRASAKAKKIWGAAKAFSSRGLGLGKGSGQGAPAALN